MPNDPSSYLIDSINVEKTLKYLEKINAENKSGPKVTMNHIIMRGAAFAASKNIRDIGRLCWGHF